jgi:hypothetical protein
MAMYDMSYLDPTSESRKCLNVEPSVGFLRLQEETRHEVRTYYVNQSTTPPSQLDWILY